MIVFSKYENEHLKHIEQTFIKYRKYGLSLNPKKYFFAMIEFKFLGHIVSKAGVRIDPERVNAINKTNLPRNKTEVQSLIGKINFLKRFIPNFA